MFRRGPGQQTARICLVHLGTPWHKGGALWADRSQEGIFLFAVCRMLFFDASAPVYSYALILGQQGLWELVFWEYFLSGFPSLSGILCNPLCNSGGGPTRPEGLELCSSKGFPALASNSSGPKETSLKCFCLKTRVQPGLYMPP